MIRSFVSLVLLDIEVSKLVRVLVRRGDVEIVSQVLLLEVLLGQVLKVSLGEGDVRVNGDLLVGGVNSDSFTQVTSLTRNLDVSLQEFSEFTDKEDLIFNGLGAVDVEAQVNLLDLLSFLSERHFYDLSLLK